MHISMFKFPVQNVCLQIEVDIWELKEPFEPSQGQDSNWQSIQ